jgi:hypothetical protein
MGCWRPVQEGFGATVSRPRTVPAGVGATLESGNSKAPRAAMEEGGASLRFLSGLAVIGFWKRESKSDHKYLRRELQVSEYCGVKSRGDDQQERKPLGPTRGALADSARNGLSS